MAEELLKQIECMGILPVIKLNNAKDAVPLAKALCERRTSVCRSYIPYRRSKRIHCGNDESLSGDAGRSRNCIEYRTGRCGNRSRGEIHRKPGLNPDTVEYCVKKGIPILPGCSSQVILSRRSNMD